MTTRILVAATIVCLTVAPTMRAADPPPNLEKLWKTYPLDPPVTTPTEPEPVPLPTPVEPTPAPPLEPSSRLALLLVGGVTGSVLLLATAGLLLVRARRPAPAPGLEHASPTELVERAYALAREAVECDNVSVAQRIEGSRRVSEPIDHDSPLPAPAQSRPGSGGYADFGERVAGVLSAAETAAEQIREDARRIAEELLDAARAEAQQLRDEAGTYDTDTRSAVDAFATERRREAELEVRKQLADAEAQARATREAAEEMARRIEAAGRQRGQQLRDESQAIEDRLKKALVGLKRMTFQLEELVGTPTADDESLTDALKPHSRSDERLPPLTAVPSDDSSS